MYWWCVQLCHHRITAKPTKKPPEPGFNITRSSAWWSPIITAVVGLSACYHKMTSRIITVINVIITLSLITTVIDMIGWYYEAWKMTSGSLIIINVILLSPNTNFPSFLQDNELVTARNDQFGDTCESLSMSSSNTPKVILKLSYFAERHVELFAFDLLTM